MKSHDMPEHPPVAYWCCPACPARYLIDQRLFNIAAMLGMTIEQADLIDVLPLDTMERAEAAVERHEQDMHGVSA